MTDLHDALVSSAAEPPAETDDTPGDHRHCSTTCVAEFTTEMLRNEILAHAAPGAAMMLDELLRRAAAPPAHAADQASLRDRVAEALLTTRRTGYEGAARHGEHRYDARCALCAADVDALTDAVLAVLPATTTSRAAVLREVAAWLNVRYGITNRAASDLRRMADEAEAAS